MTSRERFVAAMEHRQPDRVPVDIGATSLTGMRPTIHQRLRACLGFVGEPTLSNAGLDERILEWAGTDFRGVGRTVSLPSPHTRRVSASACVSCWGVRYDQIDGQSQITHSPLAGAARADLDEYAWPEPRLDDEFLASCQAQAKALHDDGRYVVVAEHPIQGVLELGCWMCGYEHFMMALAADEGFVRAFFDRLLSIQLEVIEQYYGALGPYIDLTINGDDFGTQAGPFISPEMFERLVAPYFAERIRRTKQIAGCHFWHHSCGSVFDLLDQIIACGVDILNPVQTSAAKMEPSRLKAAFGERIVFWGAMDVQQFLPSATPARVREHARELVSILGTDGGYVMAPAHQMQDDTPIENVVAWVEAIR